VPHELVLAWSDLYDDEVRYLPRKGRVPAPIFLSLFVFDRGRRSAPVVQPAIPRHFHRQVSNGFLQFVEPPKRTPAHDDFDDRFGWTLRLLAFGFRHPLVLSAAPAGKVSSTVSGSGVTGAPLSAIRRSRRDIACSNDSRASR